MINFQLFGSTTSRSWQGNYKLVNTENIYTLCGTNSGSEERDVFPNVIGAVKIIETVKSKLNLHQDIGTLLHSKQDLYLKGKTYSFKVMNPLVYFISILYEHDCQIFGKCHYIIYNFISQNEECL